MAAKRVESFRVPCLDAGSTPATSTRNLAHFQVRLFRVEVAECLESTKILRLWLKIKGQPREDTHLLVALNIQNP